MAGRLGRPASPPEYTGTVAKSGKARRVDAFRLVARYQETWTETVPAEVGASRLNASLYRSITRPLPQAHQSISFTLTQLPDPHTVTVRPRQLPTRSAGPAAAYSPPGIPAGACAHACLAVPAGRAADPVRRVGRRLRPRCRLEQGFGANGLIRVCPWLERALLRLLEVADLDQWPRRAVVHGRQRRGRLLRRIRQLRPDGRRPDPGKRGWLGDGRWLPSWPSASRSLRGRQAPPLVGHSNRCARDGTAVGTRHELDGHAPQVRRGGVEESRTVAKRALQDGFKPACRRFARCRCNDRRR